MTEYAAEAHCVFCRILRGSLPASVVFEDEETIAFMDIRPIQPGHTLVIARQHAPLLRDLDEGVRQQLWAATMRTYDALLTSDVPMDALNVVVADGAAAGQEVPHVHVHLVPRSAGDGFGFRFPEAYGSIADRTELDSMAARIRTRRATATTPTDAE